MTQTNADIAKALVSHIEDISTRLRELQGEVSQLEREADACVTAAEALVGEGAVQQVQKAA